MAKNKTESKFETTVGVAQKIYKAIRKKAIDMGEPDDIKDKELEKGYRWVSKKLESGAIITFEYTKRKGSPNTRSVLKIHNGNKEQTLSGEWARKTYIALTKETKRKSVNLDEEAQLFCTDALKGL